MLRLLKKEEERKTPLRISLEKPKGIKKIKYLLSRERIEIKKKFIFFMVFLYSLTTFGIDSKAVYKFVGEMDRSLNPISKYFRKIDLLVNKWGYKQDRACLLASLRVPSKLLKDFLYRLAYNISIGANFVDFIKIEYNKFTIDYDYYFQKTIDKLRIIADVYTALLDAAIIVSMTAVMASILFGAGNTYGVMALIILITVTSLFTALSLIKINIPEDIMHAHSMPYRPKRLKTLDRIAKPVLYAIGVASFIPVFLAYFVLDNELFITDTVVYSLQVSLFYIIPGAAGIVIGKLGLSEIRKIEEYDSIYPIFISTLGEAASLSGSLKEGLRRILYNDYGKLTPLIKRLYARLKMGIEPDVAWRLFSEETGSNLVLYLTSIFTSAVNKGAIIRDTARVLYETSVRFSKRRQGRNQIYNYFKGMAIPLQATFVAVLTLIVVLISLFTRFAAAISKFMQYIEMPSVSFLLIFLYLMVAVVSIGNSWAIYILKGDSIYTFIYHLGLTLLISGGVFFLMAGGSASLLGSFAKFERGVGSVFIP